MEVSNIHVYYAYCSLIKTVSIAQKRTLHCTKTITSVFFLSVMVFLAPLLFQDFCYVIHE